MLDTYKTLSSESIGEFRDRGSKFLAYAYPVYTEEAWQTRLEEVKKLHHKARHWCYAYRLGIDKNNFRANDDGEPSGTAGRPILGQIDSFGLSNVFVVVVRYFGGTKLGTSGLINAYKTATANAFEQANIVDKMVEDVYRFTFDYSIMSDVMNAIKKNEIEPLKQDFGDIAVLEIAIRQSEVDSTLRLLRSQIAKIRIEEIDEVEEIKGLKLEFLHTR